MRVAYGAASWSGRALDLRDVAVSVRALAAGVRATGSVVVDEGRELRVHCEPPGRVFEHVGVVSPGAAVDVRAALAAVAWSREESVDGVEALAAAREELAAVEVPEVDVSAARERVAEARAAAEAVTADVAAARGAVQAREDLDADVDAGRERLRAAVADASERETELVAAEQALARERELAREARDVRERRLSLADRVGRLEREVRANRVATTWSAFRDAVVAVPGGSLDDVDAEPGSFAGDDATAALAAVRVANVTTPVVVGIDRFDDAETAHQVLDAPVVLAAD
ncbi:BREX-1 system adenine-specific DNA-methyltransferase PglX [Halorubellus salinus]|uniref:BREX-1 system adenine-specific DNA-methyltransferase PglX n=1 Tax=Halorubellus salinus TaxID=755309 RepID=UPI001D0807EA|nr:BREX-1 system adenine-specific DNA-methyltransferase PglX [Halorubellus salinus]